MPNTKRRRSEVVRERKIHRSFNQESRIQYKNVKYKAVEEEEEKKLVFGVLWTGSRRLKAKRQSSIPQAVVCRIV
jgi:hypothetical protein